MLEILFGAVVIILGIIIFLMFMFVISLAAELVERSISRFDDYDEGDENYWDIS